MLLRPRLLRHRSRRYQRPLFYTLLVLYILDVWWILRGRKAAIRSSISPVAKAAGDGGGSSTSFAAQNQQHDYPTVFIVSVHRNTEKILRSSWNENLVRLVDRLGHDRVYVSAVESGSQDHTKEALMDLEAQLAARGVNHTIDLGTTVWEQLDELYAWPAPNTPAAERRGWIWDSDEGHYALRRIPYLARVRNQAMAPLLAEAARHGRRFDRVLWINDVAFDTEDVLTLLDTRGGHYAAACAMDFKAYPLYYDTFALRDADGDKAVSPHWPWFRSAEARADVRAGRPVRVQSCWNGMVVFHAQPFYDTRTGTEFESESSLAGGHTPQPLLFRGVDDSLAEFHLEGSECCLIHADNPLSRFSDVPPSTSRRQRPAVGVDADTDAESGKDVGVWLNPNVRVAYSAPVYNQVRAGGGGNGVFPGGFWAVYGTWANRWQRALSNVQFVLEGQTVLHRLRRWRTETPAGDQPRNEPGAVCLINEMQIMWQNGWKHL
ncbi:hypothetical protein SEPCBS119000_001376 [Sporothrix epigloea]|uniref:Polysaccharide export protein n=1 Tax=Sporothrix epigloea TaxID=1892477 RepID=A0ABP0DE47_9PEZI